MSASHSTYHKLAGVREANQSQSGTPTLLLTQYPKSVGFENFRLKDLTDDQTKMPTGVD